MLSCKEIVEQASDYLEQEMSPWRRLQYRMHLFMCRHCRRFTSQFAAGVSMLRRLPQRSEPCDHSVEIERVMQRIDKQS